MKKVSFTRNCAFTVMERSAATWQSMPAPAVASNCVVVVDRHVFVFIFGPTHTPPPLSRPAGRKRGASYGRVFEVSQYTRHCALGFWGRIPIRGTTFELANKGSPIWALTPIAPTCFSNGYISALNTWPNVVLAPFPARRGGRGRGVRVGPKMKRMQTQQALQTLRRKVSASSGAQPDTSAQPDIPLSSARYRGGP
jgi:hypothetical protein